MIFTITSFDFEKGWDKIDRENSVKSIYLLFSSEKTKILKKLKFATKVYNPKLIINFKDIKNKFQDFFDCLSIALKMFFCQF